MKRIVVFCGASSGNDEIFVKEAFSLGQKIAEKNIEVVYGGACIGLMGAVADGALSRGGKVIGVLPKFLQTKEVGHQGLTEMIIVDTMHERKTKMSELADGIIAMPGGFGTMEEYFEMVTWAQLGLHQKPIGLFNVKGFYDSLVSLSQNMVDMGFVAEVHQKLIIVDDNADDLLNEMQKYSPPDLTKWIKKDEV